MSENFTIIALLISGFYAWAKTLGLSKPLKILVATITAVGLAFLETDPFLFGKITLGLAIAFSVSGLVSVPDDLLSSAKMTVAEGKRLLGGKDKE